ncbi:MBL fold metallo-hydrolase [Candidatus Saccharibacteria bacterium]|nr:MBL fold metallo-hydrolase [Candidatus Saccharibacteria bacterium]
MELQFYGANCIRLSGKKSNVVIDDNLSEIGLKSVTKAGDIALFTNSHSDPNTEVKIAIDTAGEYEVSNVSIRGVAARAHMDEEGKQTAVIYRLVIEDVRVAVVGHIYPELSEEQLEAIGTVDVLVVPVGGNGYTLDPIGASKVIRKIEPRIIVPTHYEDKAIKYEVPQQPLEEALKALSMEPKETVDKLKLKSTELGELTQLIVLERQ